MLDTNLNSVNADQSGVVDQTKTDGTTSAVADTQLTAGDVANSKGNQPQSKEDNSRYAEMRRNMESAEKELNAAKSTNATLMAALNRIGYEGSETDILNKLNAEEMGITVEEYKKREKEHNERILQDPRIVEAQKVIRERQFEKDLQSIKEVYPEVDVKSVLKVGDIYINIMKNGGVSAVDAYAAQIAFNEREKSKIPPAIGSVNTNTPGEKEYYTPDEVDKLTEKDLDNPKIMERVMNSMKHWK